MQATVHDLHYNHSRQIAAKQDPVTDEQLLIEYRKTGDRELFAQLVYRYESELFGFLKRYLRDTEMAEDVFQKTFLNVHLKCDQFEKSRRFRPWLYGIATNAAIDAKRRVKRRPTISLDTTREANDQFVGRLADLLESDGLSPEETFEREELREQVRKTIDQLPESLLSVVQLVYFQGMMYREAAEALNIPLGTVKSRMHDAIRKLAEQWNSSQVD